MAKKVQATKRHVPTPREYPPQPEGPPEVVDPVWLLKAVAITILGALFCAYLTLCLLVYQGQWQLVLHPAESTAAVSGVGEAVRFGAGETGQPRLAGTWIGTDAAHPTVLLLPDGSGALSDDTETLKQLSSLPVNVLGFDYRSFGASERGAHPTQLRMAEDAEAALDYLVSTRHINPRTIVPYGVGLGGSLAVALAAKHPELPGVMVEGAVPDVLAIAKADQRSQVVPLGWLFHERFPISGPLASLKTPKLLLTDGPSKITAKQSGPMEVAYREAAAPSRIVHLPAWTPGSQTSYREALRRFLDEFVPSAAH